MANTLYLVSRVEGPEEVLFGYCSVTFESTHTVPDNYYPAEEFIVPKEAPFQDDFTKFFFTQINNLFIVKNNTLVRREIDYWSYDIKSYGDGTPQFINIRYSSGVLKHFGFRPELDGYLKEFYPEKQLTTIWTWDDVEFTADFWLQELISPKVIPYMSSGRELPTHLRDMQNLLLDMRDNFSDPQQAIDAMRGGPQGLGELFNINWK